MSKIKRAIIEFEKGVTVEFTKPLTAAELTRWVDCYANTELVNLVAHPSEPMRICHRCRLHHVGQPGDPCQVWIRGKRCGGTLIECDCYADRDATRPL